MAHLSLQLLGPLQAMLDGQPVNCKYDKVRALLVYLAVEAERPHRREALLGLLWPDLPEAAARNNLRQVLTTLRDALGDRTAIPPFLLVDRTAVQFNPAADCSLDVKRFTDRLAAAAHHPHRRPENCKICAGHLAQAVEIYGGSFLAQFFLPDSDAFEAWATIKREQLQQGVLAALAHLVLYHERRGDYPAALRYARRQLQLEPWHEEAHRQAMRLYILAGDRSAALAQYEACRRMLAEELGVEPEEATTALYREISTMGEGEPLAATALATPTARTHTLPPPSTPFIGREQELARLSQLLADPACRLVTLTGPGGIGKTRLALQAAAEQLDDYADGVHFVPLAGLGAPDLLADAIIRALRLDGSATSSPATQLLAHLQEQELLLVLDNFEHLLPSAASAPGARSTWESGVGLVAAILQQAPDVTLMVTSRQRLNLQGEWLLPVAGLPLPHPPDADPALALDLAANDAIQLFVQSARRVQPAFSFTTTHGASILRICQCSAGLPLAIELAAAWVRVLSCEEIVAELERNSGILTTTLHDVPERHRSMAAVFNHSWRLLTEEEQAVLRRLAVFQGGCGRTAAEEVAGATLPVLAALVDKSLLSWHPLRRYILHPLVRQYAQEKLQAAEEATEIRDRHLGCYLVLAETAHAQLNGPEQTQWLDRLETEHDNLHAALAWSLNGGDAETGLRLAVALYPFWYWRNHFRTGHRWLEQTLLATTGEKPASTPLQARALWAAGVLAEMQDDRAQAAKRYEESLALRRTLGDQAGLAASLNSLGALRYRQHDYAQAQALFEESLALRRTLGQRGSLANPLNNLGLTALVQGDFGRAEVLFEECLVLYQEMENTASVAMALYNLGTALLARGESRRAQSYFAESLSLQQTVMDKDGLAGALEGIAAAVVVQKQDLEISEWAARLLGAAAALRAAIGAPILPVMQTFYDRAVATVRATLDEETFVTVWAEGQTLSLEQAIAAAKNAPAIAQQG
jgi:predicted ATPase/DNA-binding SARP family transcriptional activator